MFRLITIISFSFLFSFQVSASDSWSQVVDFQTKMAKSGSIKAQFILGEMYEQGRGVGKNLKQALRWYSKAKQGGHKDAALRMAKVNYMISNPQPQSPIVKAVATKPVTVVKPVVPEAAPVEQVTRPVPKVKVKQVAKVVKKKKKIYYRDTHMETISAFDDGDDEESTTTQSHMNNFVESFE